MIAAAGQLVKCAEVAASVRICGSLLSFVKRDYYLCTLRGMMA